MDGFALVVGVVFWQTQKAMMRMIVHLSMAKVIYDILLKNDETMKLIAAFCAEICQDSVKLRHKVRRATQMLDILPRVIAFASSTRPFAQWQHFPDITKNRHLRHKKKNKKKSSLFLCSLQDVARSVTARASSKETDGLSSLWSYW